MLKKCIVLLIFKVNYDFSVWFKVNPITWCSNMNCKYFIIQINTHHPASLLNINLDSPQIAAHSIISFNTLVSFKQFNYLPATSWMQIANCRFNTNKLLIPRAWLRNAYRALTVLQLAARPCAAANLIYNCQAKAIFMLLFMHLFWRIWLLTTPHLTHFQFFHFW